MDHTLSNSHTISINTSTVISGDTVLLEFGDSPPIITSPDDTITVRYEDSNNDYNNKQHRTVDRNQRSQKNEKDKKRDQAVTMHFTNNNGYDIDPIYEETSIDVGRRSISVGSAIEPVPRDHDANIDNSYSGNISTSNKSVKKMTNIKNTKNREKNHSYSNHSWKNHMHHNYNSSLKSSKTKHKTLNENRSGSYNYLKLDKKASYSAPIARADFMIKKANTNTLQLQSFNNNSRSDNGNQRDEESKTGRSNTNTSGTAIETSFEQDQLAPLELIYHDSGSNTRDKSHVSHSSGDRDRGHRIKSGLKESCYHLIWQKYDFITKRWIDLNQICCSMLDSQVTGQTLTMREARVATDINVCKIVTVYKETKNLAFIRNEAYLVVPTPLRRICVNTKNNHRVLLKNHKNYQINNQQPAKSSIQGINDSTKYTNGNNDSINPTSSSISGINNSATPDKPAMSTMSDVSGSSGTGGNDTNGTLTSNGDVVSGDSKDGGVGADGNDKEEGVSAYYSCPSEVIHAICCDHAQSIDKGHLIVRSTSSDYKSKRQISNLQMDQSTTRSATLSGSSIHGSWSSDYDYSMDFECQVSFVNKHITVDESFIDVKVSLTNDEIISAKHAMRKDFNKHFQSILGINFRFLFMFFIGALGLQDVYLDFDFLIHGIIHKSDSLFVWTIFVSVLPLFWYFAFTLKFNNACSIFLTDFLTGER